MDGEKAELLEEQIEHVSDEYNTLLSENTAFTEFKGFALAGYDMRRVSLGKTYPLLCVGHTGTDHEQIKTKMKDVEACTTVYSRLETLLGQVGDQGLHKRIDDVEERGNKSRAVNRDGYEVLVDDSSPEDLPPSDATNNIIVLGLFVVAAAFLINSVG